MIAKICDRHGIKSIRWIEGEEVTPISYASFLKLPCENPRDADDSLGTYYDKTLWEIVSKWAENNREYELKEAAFGFTKEAFRSNLIALCESEKGEFPVDVFKYDMSHYVAYRNYCKTRYDIFVAFIEEFVKIL
ncbi:hypothetical protein [Desulfosporosinus sp. OT]|uniref:hypothetical protein n=1 Tax=Desulfosporosinus sp. OT TaxID=913865 RepID=UPI000223A06E|nr:hypothetical protein [Desulfosporosinus sp. OT]EGW37171.1 hypothetical protein DOT_4710 [Desulfosporosinus sp. OT]